jgi:CRISPR/Cas system CSM-associated protein Csm2 small subunit
MDQLWKDIATILGPIAGVLIGWFLNEFGQLAKLRREDRRTLGKALTILLDVYDSAARLRAIEKHLQGMTNLSPSSLRMFKDILRNLNDIQGRYEETVNTLAASDPVGAYNLRSKVDSLNEVYRLRKDHLTKLAEGEKSEELIVAFKDFDQLHQHLQSDRLRAAVLKLARRHGWLTWVRVKRVIAATDFAESNITSWSKELANSYINYKSKDTKP